MLSCSTITIVHLSRPLLSRRPEIIRGEVRLGNPRQAEVSSTMVKVPPIEVVERMIVFDGCVPWFAMAVLDLPTGAVRHH